MLIYLIGSLKSPRVPETAAALRNAGFDVFDDWFAPGPEADDYWKKYEQGRGRTYAQALTGFAAKHIFEFDLYHINRSDIGLLVLPAGKSGHLELGYMLGQGKKGYILLEDDNTRWDVMYQFATAVCNSKEELIERLERERSTRSGREADETSWSTMQMRARDGGLSCGTILPRMRTPEQKDRSRVALEERARKENYYGKDQGASSQETT